ncbi:hypothetical protein SHK09_04625 [Polaribacter sp. PL03]|uniref:hypothetical protein n=1 Tax=Polaribacter sp. PL03 TaxID=3088353 RepID=UPI0029CC588C|nr:hypothetical protein [Polaribacter sp. PL03]MDX6746067.1 hypothetical protein [Polaribacter sp. PL03]
MIKKIIRTAKELIKLQRSIHQQSLENEWANVYHDSIRGVDFIQKLPLNIGRWAGNYTFFYILNRILKDVRPNSILEFGLGESSKFISCYLDNLLINSDHKIIEHDVVWKENFTEQFEISNNTEIQICELVQIDIKGNFVNSYSNIESVIDKKYDLYLVDGPFGSKYFSRYDIVNIANNFDENDEFIIIIDDYNRFGEKQTSEDLIDLFIRKNIKIYKRVYSGNKSLMIFVTEKYKFLTSL